MNGPTLRAILDLRRPELLERLGRYPEPAPAVVCLRDFLDGLPGDYAAEHAARGTPLDRRSRLIVQRSVEALVATVGTLGWVRLWMNWAPEEPGVLRRLAGWDSDPPPRPRVWLYLDSRRLVDAVAAALEAVDLAFVEAGVVDGPGAGRDGAGADGGGDPSTRPAWAGWAADADLLDLFQDLFAAGARRDGALALGRIDHLADEIRLRHGIEVVHYSPDHERLFDLRPNPDPNRQVPVTRRPALLAATGAVLRRGEVLLPAADLAVPTGQDPPVTTGADAGGPDADEPGDGGRGGGGGRATGGGGPGGGGEHRRPGERGAGESA